MKQKHQRNNLIMGCHLTDRSAVEYKPNNSVGISGGSFLSIFFSSRPCLKRAMRQAGILLGLILPVPIGWFGSHDIVGTLSTLVHGAGRHG